MAVHLTQSRMMEFVWEYSNDWDFTLGDLDSKFGGWIPATAVELGFYGVTLETLGQTGAEYINGNTLPTITFSYVDTVDHRVTRWITNWTKECVSQDGYEVATVQQAQKDFVLRKHNPQNEVIFSWRGRVIPNGTVTYAGDTDASNPTYQVSLTPVSGSFKYGAA
jgi:hypothetical protein